MMQLDNFEQRGRRVRHTCHWTGCRIEVPPKMAMCKSHWWSLPAELRRRIWAAYRPGQEIDKRPSQAYLDVMKETLEWIAERTRKLDAQAAALSTTGTITGGTSRSDEKPVDSRPS